jgi:rod shape-determining protein MreC
MPVITAEGVVGKVLRVFGSTSQVLLINDQTSGAGAILEKSRLQGILRGTPTGELALEKVMADEQVQPGERVLTSGGDDVFPKGMPAGTVSQVFKGKDSFLNIRVRPAAGLDKLEEVLVIIQQEKRTPALAEGDHPRAADILAQRLPSVPEKQAENATKDSGAGSTKSAAQAQSSASSGTPQVLKTEVPKPQIPKADVPKVDLPKSQAAQPFEPKLRDNAAAGATHAESHSEPAKTVVEQKTASGPVTISDIEPVPAKTNTKPPPAKPPTGTSQSAKPVPSTQPAAPKSQPQ